jgi:hypothetical protein
MKMSRLYRKVVAREKADNSYAPRKRELARQAFGQKLK